MDDLTPQERKQRNEDIVRLYTAGMTHGQVAARFGLSRTMTWKIIKKAGARLSEEEKNRRRREFPRGPSIIWTPEMNRAVIVARINGAPVKKCAEVVGVSYNLAWKKLAEFGLANEAKAA